MTVSPKPSCVSSEAEADSPSSISLTANRLRDADLKGPRYNTGTFVDTQR